VPGYSASFSYGVDKIRRYAPGYDIISYDQRGIGRTTPAVNCYGSALASAATLMNTVHQTTFDVPPDPFSAAGTRHMVAQQREAMAIMQLQADICGKNVGADVLKYMGTTTLIKDMERISAVLEGKDAKINFFGGSYGTCVAEYLLNMLPHKAGRVVAWGVADPVT
jgi:pimeloyl-ACP methyl ester carboxylesterase